VIDTFTTDQIYNRPHSSQFLFITVYVHDKPCS